eukprot:gene25057-32669_t
MSNTLFWIFLLKICNFIIVKCTASNVCSSEVAYEWVENVVPDWNYRLKIPLYVSQRYLSDYVDVDNLHRGNSFACKLSITNYNLGCRNFPLDEYMAVLRIYYAISSEEIQQLQISSLGSSYFVDTNFSESKYINMISTANEVSVLTLVLQRLSTFIEELNSSNSLREYLHALHFAVNISLRSISNLNESFRCEDDIPSMIFHSISNVTEPDLQKVLSSSDLVVDLVQSYIVRNLVPFFERNCGKVVAKSNTNFTVIDTKRTSYGDHFCNLSLVQFDDYSSHLEIEDLTLFTRKRLLYCTGGEVDLKANVEGYGSFSSIYMTCFGGNGASESNACHVWRQRPCSYNSVIVSAGLAILHQLKPLTLPYMKKLLDVDKESIFQHVGNSRTLMEQYLSNVTTQIIVTLVCRGIPFLDRVQCPQTTRVLSLGLGGGELHVYLLTQFPCMEVDSVEVNSDLVSMVEKNMALQSYICRLQTIGNRSSESEGEGEVNVERLQTLRDDHSQDGLPCRSRVIIGDAWDYISYALGAHRSSMEVDASGNVRGGEVADDSSWLYDVIIFDVFTDNDAWDGTVNGGESNSYVDKASSTRSLQSVRDLLTPYTGMAMFHIHRDSQHDKYVASIENYFHHSQMAVLAVTTNDNVVAVFKDAFQDVQNQDNDNYPEEKSLLYRIHDHPCLSPVAFADHVVDFSRTFQFLDSVAYEGQFALN